MTSLNEFCSTLTVVRDWMFGSKQGALINQLDAEYFTVDKPKLPYKLVQIDWPRREGKTTILFIIALYLLRTRKDTTIVFIYKGCSGLFTSFCIFERYTDYTMESTNIMCMGSNRIQFYDGTKFIGKQKQFILIDEVQCIKEKILENYYGMSDFVVGTSSPSGRISQ